MNIWQASQPYTLTTGYAESYWFNTKKRGHNGEIYDGVVVPMNPERMEFYATDIVFNPGQQSHAFNSWRVLKDGANSGQANELWPPKLLNDDYKTRLVAVNYEV